MSETPQVDALIAELQTYSTSLAEIDRGHFHGMMTSIRMETIDVVGRACLQLDKLHRELSAIHAITQCEALSSPQESDTLTVKRVRGLIERNKRLERDVNWALDQRDMTIREMAQQTERAESAEAEARSLSTALAVEFGKRIATESRIASMEALLSMPFDGALVHLQNKLVVAQSRIAELEADAEQREWLVWSVESRVWWKADRRGYTHYARQAGRYTLAEAQSVCRVRSWHDGMPPEAIVHESALDAEGCRSDGRIECPMSAQSTGAPT